MDHQREGLASRVYAAAVKRQSTPLRARAMEILGVERLDAADGVAAVIQELLVRPRT